MQNALEPEHGQFFWPLVIAGCQGPNDHHSDGGWWSKEGHDLECDAT